MSWLSIAHDIMEWLLYPVRNQGGDWRNKISSIFESSTSVCTCREPNWHSGLNLFSGSQNHSFAHTVVSINRGIRW